MPHRLPGRFPRLATLVAAIVLGLGFAATAGADGPPNQRPGGSPTPVPPLANACTVLRVHLNGDQPATQTCLATVPTGQGAGVATAAAQATSCPATDLQIFVDTKFGGARMCFGGTGSVSCLDCYTYWVWGWPRSWSDAMSSFITGQYYVNFYEHGAARGERLRYASYQSRASMPSGWNDRVSSLCLLSPPTYWCP